MNYRMIKTTLGWLLIFEAAFFILPLITGIVYGELWPSLSFVFSILIALAAGFSLVFFMKPKTKKLYSKDGFVIVALSWIALSLFGALPFIFTGATNNPDASFFENIVNALFESASGFTTTGASVISNIEAQPASILLWRSFTHWIGGMGVLVFIMAFLPLGGAQNMHIMKAESPGPSVSKLVPKIRTTAAILYSIYIFMTVLQIGLLMIFDVSFFEALNITLSTAGTGGFGIMNNSMESYSSIVQIITAVFMFLFSINFSSYYLAMKGKLKDSLNSELRAFVIIVAVAITILTVDVMSAQIYSSLGEAIKHTSFTVSSIISTTGFSTTNFSAWPELSRTIIVLIMFIGACAGSTGGGMKVSRIIILVKGFIREIGSIIHPKQVKKITLDKKPVDHEVVRSVNAYIACYAVIFVASLILISFDERDLITNFTSVTSAINNVGAGIDGIGPYSSEGFAAFTPFSKLVLTFDMIAGRLELFPMLVLFNPFIYRKKKS